ncbi:MAG TPA: DUF1080 domain-containing protein [Puia sp.]
MLKKVIALFILCAGVVLVHAQTNNQLSSNEFRDGWRLLFDGKTPTGWHTYNKKSFGPAWKIIDGNLYCDSSYHVPKGDEGDICTDAVYENFDLKYEWKISRNGNSGVMFLVQESPQYDAPYLTGPEMQVLDNDGHPDGKIHKHRAGDLYDLIASASEPVHPVGEWNKAEIKLDHGSLTLTLNGVIVVATTLWDAHWDTLVSFSKFSKMPGFAKFKSGHIDLQDHDGNGVWFRNIRIKTL